MTSCPLISDTVEALATLGWHAWGWIPWIASIPWMISQTDLKELLLRAKPTGRWGDICWMCWILWRLSLIRDISEGIPRRPWWTSWTPWMSWTRFHQWKGLRHLWTPSPCSARLVNVTLFGGIFKRAGLSFSKVARLEKQQTLFCVPV